MQKEIDVLICPNLDARAGFFAWTVGANEKHLLTFGSSRRLRVFSPEWRGTQTAGKGCKAFVGWFDSIPRRHSSINARLLHDDPSALG